MTLVLRLVRQSRWDTPDKRDWLAEGEIPADPLADFATNENCLSVWLVNDDKRDLVDVTAALAASRERADKLDYVLFPLDHLLAAGIEIRETSGQTPDRRVNGLHRDLTHLSAANVLALTNRVWHENLGLYRIDQRQAVQLVAAGVSGGQILLEGLRPKLRDNVRSSIADQRGGRQAAK